MKRAVVMLQEAMEQVPLATPLSKHLRPVCLSLPHTRARACTQGHVEAAETIGAIFYWGQGVKKDMARALGAYKFGAEKGNAICQFGGSCCFF